VRVLVLPGMDGGDSLSARFRSALAARGHAPEGVRYPQVADHERLTEHVRDRLDGEPSVIVAESFSGPLAIRLAAAPPPALRAVVLVATFASPPRSAAFRWLARAPLFALPAPAFAIRRAMVDPDASVEDVRAVQAAIRESSPAVLAARVREVLSTDVRVELRASRVPLFAIRAGRDRLVPASASVARLLEPDSRAVIDAPHLVLFARAEQAAARVARCLAAQRG
jgi:pimeloyl-ACP methyl ester carboxylesterase